MFSDKDTEDEEQDFFFICIFPFENINPSKVFLQPVLSLHLPVSAFEA